jgi:predicted ferric reductase
MAMINRLNQLSYWVPSMILWHSTLNDRAKVVTKFINIANELRQMNNFNSLMGIIAGLNMASICRLNFTLSAVNEKFSGVSPSRTQHKNYLIYMVLMFWLLACFFLVA